MPEQEFPIATIDAALFSLTERGLSVGLLERERDPFGGQLALPGGYVRVEEDRTTDDTARRVLTDKAGVTVRYLEQLYTFSGKSRDPRGWSISVVYFALIPPNVLRDGKLGCLEFVSVDGLPTLPFDHNEIIETALRRLRDKSTYSTLPALLLPVEFTFGELQEAYEQILGHRLDLSSFRRKIRELDLIEVIEGRKRGGRHRPAQLYRLKSDALEAFDRTI